MKKKKMSPMLKITLIMLASAVIGGVVGFAGAWIMDGRATLLKEIQVSFLDMIRSMAIPVMIVVLVLTVLAQEWNLKKQSMLGDKIQTEEDDEACDRWEYELEKVSAFGTAFNTISMVACMLILSTGYSLKYMEDGHAGAIMILCVLFLIGYAYDAYWQIRMVNLTKKIYPKMQGDPSSSKFHEQWLASCDEAEREQIYKSAYKCYIQTGKWLQVLLLITMLGQLFFQTGILAIVVVATIWLIMTLSYLRSCVSLKKASLHS